MCHNFPCWFKAHASCKARHTVYFVHPVHTFSVSHLHLLRGSGQRKRSIILVHSPLIYCTPVHEPGTVHTPASTSHSTPVPRPSTVHHQSASTAWCVLRSHWNHVTQVHAVTSQYQFHCPKLYFTSVVGPSTGCAHSLVQWNWFSDVTGCTWVTCIKWRQKTDFTARCCTPAPVRTPLHMDPALCIHLHLLHLCSWTQHCAYISQGPAVCRQLPTWSLRPGLAVPWQDRGGFLGLNDALTESAQLRVCWPYDRLSQLNR